MRDIHIVTGGAGFIGRALVRRLLAHDPECVVHVIDDGSASRLDDVETERVVLHRMDAAQLPRPPVDYDAVASIFHLAAVVGVQRAVVDGRRMMRRNRAATEGALLLARACRRARLVFASSSEVYGDTDVQPLVETATLAMPPCTSPRHGYTWEKAYGESDVLVESAEVDAVVARLFNTSGRGQSTDGGAVLPTMADAAVRGLPITVYTHAGAVPTRSFCHVDDTAAGLHLMALSGERGEIYNVGRADEIDMCKLAEVVRDAAGSDVPVLRSNRCVDRVGCMRRVPDVTKLTRLGWAPRYSTEDIVRDVVEWRREIVKCE